MIMDIPRRASSGRSSLALPEIHVSNPHDRHHAGRSNSYSFATSPTRASSAMPIPNVREGIGAPPPLPPPKDIEDLANGGGRPRNDIAWQWGASNERSDWGRTVNPNSSLHGTFPSRPDNVGSERPDFARRGSSNTTIKASGLAGAPEPYPMIEPGGPSLYGSSAGSNSNLLVNLVRSTRSFTPETLCA